MRKHISVLGLVCLGVFVLGGGVSYGQQGGPIVAWGYNTSGQCNVPTPNADFVAVAGGGTHSLGLKSDGTIVAWGANSNGQCNVPAPNADFVAVAGGGTHSLGLKSDGTIVAWGANFNGQCNVPAPNADFVAVAGGFRHNLGLKSDGTIIAWGENNYGQCDVPVPNADFVAVAAGQGYSLGLKSEGTIVVWGYNSYGIPNVPAPNADFVAVASGSLHGLGLKSDGTIIAWGYNASGQLYVPAPNADFIAVAGGYQHSLGLKSDGTIVTWGYNNHGQCNVPEPNANFVALAGGMYHSLGLRHSSCGFPEIVCFEPSTVSPDSCPGGCTVTFTVSTSGDYSGVQKITLERGLSGIWVEEDSVVAPIGAPDWTLTCEVDLQYNEGEHAFRAVFYCEDGSKSYSPSVFVTVMLECAVPEIVSFEPVVVNPDTCSDGCSVNFTVGTEDDYSDVQKIMLERSLSGAWVQEDSIPTPIGDPDWTLTCEIDEQYPDGKHAFRAVFYCEDGSKSYTLPVFLTVIRLPVLTGSIVAWGANDAGQCNTPEPNADFVTVAGGFSHSLGLKSDGMIEAWGYNTYGQCNVPAPNADFVAIAAGGLYSLGLKSDLTIVAWGNNVPAPNMDFVAIAAGGYHSLGLKPDGTIIAWGNNGSGQCIVPAPNGDFVAVAGGGEHSLGLKADGTIAAWGRNYGGECDVPAPNMDFVAIAAGGYHSLGLKSDGTIIAWGNNVWGQCNVPAPNADFVAITGGSFHSLGLKSDGTIVAWGNNTYGECDVPAPNADFVAIAAGGYHSLGLRHSSCGFPEIVSFDPVLVNPDSCSGGCPVSFTVNTADDYSGVQKITLERNLLGTWVEEDSILAPIGDPLWTVSCQIDEQYTDGQHAFRAVFHCVGGSRSHSFSVFVTVMRTIPVIISGFEVEYADGGVLLRWTIAEGRGLQGFNIYRALTQDTGFERVNDELISAGQGNEYVDRGAGTGETYWYRLGAVADDGEWMSQTVSIAIPKAALALHQNVPNPFNPTTTITFTLPERARATLAIYDVEGRHVRTLVDEVLAGGKNEAAWDGKDAQGHRVSSGVYLYRLNVGNQTITKKLTVLK